MKKLATFLFSCIFWGSFLYSCSTHPETDNSSLPTEPVNILFILADDLGRMDLGCYGSTFYETPHLDQLANNGMLFTDAYAACPVCSPTRASILTGKYPARIDVTDWIPGRQSYLPIEPNHQLVAQEFAHEVKLEEKMLSEALKEQGYTTFFGGKWHVGEEDDYWPEHQGFDINKGGHNKGSPPGGYFSPYKNPRLSDGPEGEYLTDRLTTEAVQFLDTIGENPFLLYMSYYTVHNPMQGKDSLVAYFQRKADSLGISDEARYNTAAEWINKAPQKGNFRERLIQDHAVYASMVYSLDENIGRMIEALERNGLKEKTIVIFTSDNGGLSTSEGSPTSNLPFRAGKGWLYEGGIREPLIVSWPAHIGAGTTSPIPISSPDFYPTILELAQISSLPSQHIDGVSFRSVLLATKEENKPADNLTNRPLFWHYPHYSNQGGRPGGAIRKGDWKLIEWYETGEVELYNLKNDPGEKNELSQETQDKVVGLKTELEEWRQEVQAKMMKRNSDFDANYMRK